MPDHEEHADHGDTEDCDRASVMDVANLVVMAAVTPRTGPWRVQVGLFDGVEEIDFVAPFEVCAAALRQ